MTNKKREKFIFRIIEKFNDNRTDNKQAERQADMKRQVAIYRYHNNKSLIYEDDYY